MPYPLRHVPSVFTGEQRTWLQELADRVAGMPAWSFFSGTTPESVVTGVAGDWALNL